MISKYLCKRFEENQFFFLYVFTPTGEKIGLSSEGGARWSGSVAPKGVGRVVPAGGGVRS